MKPIYLDVPEGNIEVIKRAENPQMKTVFEITRMYSKETSDIECHQLYGVTIFE